MVRLYYNRWIVYLFEPIPLVFTSCRLLLFLIILPSSHFLPVFLNSHIYRIESVEYFTFLVLFQLVSELNVILVVLWVGL